MEEGRRQRGFPPAPLLLLPLRPGQQQTGQRLRLPHLQGDPPHSARTPEPNQPGPLRLPEPRSDDRRRHYEQPRALRPADLIPGRSQILSPELLIKSPQQRRQTEAVRRKRVGMNAPPRIQQRRRKDDADLPQDAQGQADRALALEPPRPPREIHHAPRRENRLRSQQQPGVRHDELVFRIGRRNPVFDEIGIEQIASDGPDQLIGARGGIVDQFAACLGVRQAGEQPGERGQARRQRAVRVLRHRHSGRAAVADGRALPWRVRKGRARRDALKQLGRHAQASRRGTLRQRVRDTFPYQTRVALFIVDGKDRGRRNRLLHVEFLAESSIHSRQTSEWVAWRASRTLHYNRNRARTQWTVSWRGRRQGVSHGPYFSALCTAHSPSPLLPFPVPCRPIWPPLLTRQRAGTVLTPNSLH